MESFVFTAVLVIYILHFVFHFYAEYLNDRARAREIPDNVSDVYDPDNYRKWRKYSSELNRVSFIDATIRFLFVLMMLANGGFFALAEWTRALTNANPYLETLLFIFILIVIHFLYAIPFKYYVTFSIEERYGFNRSDLKTFIRDRIVSLLLSIVLGGGIIALFVLFFETAGPLFILYMFIALVVIFLFFNMTYTKIFVPLFNKLTPLEDGDLKTRIEDFAAAQNYQIKKIQVMDASRRSSKLNAFFSGFGRFKNVVLFDTLLEKMDDDEVLAVLAHEIAHAKHKDVIKNIVQSFVLFAALLALFYGFTSVEVFHTAFGFDALHLGFMLMLFGIIFGPISTLIGVFTNLWSRHNEYAADRFAAKHFKTEAMVSALKVLARENFSNLTPHPLFVVLHYSHPPMDKRIAALRSH